MTESLSQRLSRHPFFTPHTDPKSGVISYVLTERAAPYHKGLYFMTPSLRGTNEWLWFRAGFPPDKQMRLCAVRLDPDRPEIKTFPHLRMTGNPWIDPSGEVAYVPQDNLLIRQPVVGDWSEELRMNPNLVNKRHLFLLCTNASCSCDGKYFVFDSHVGDEFISWIHNRETGEQTVLHRFPRKMHHSTFSLHDPKLYFLHQGPGNDPYTGTRINIETRTWLMDIDGERLEPLTPDLWFGHNAENCHEWWTSEGKVQFCDYRTGIWEVNLETKERELVWARPSIHGQCSPDCTWISCDENTYAWNETNPCSVWALHRPSGTEILVAGHLPPPPFGRTDWRDWHPDPHSHFSEDSQALIYTTTVLDSLNVAISPMDDWPINNTPSE